MGAIKKPANELIKAQAEQYIERLEVISREGKAADKAVSELREAQESPKTLPSQQNL